MTNPSPGSPGTHGDEAYEAATVRPYAVTGGRVRSATSDLPLETLVEVPPGAVHGPGLPPEKRAILQHAAHGYVSIAELSAILRLPVGVVRVLVADLADDNHLIVHASAPLDVRTGHGGDRSGVSLSVLESVLDGISTL